MLYGKEGEGWSAKGDVAIPSGTVYQYSCLTSFLLWFTRD